MAKLTAMQSRLVELFKKFHTVCEENHLKYYMVFGTMLGAVRHGGFIPWDDDIDVAMPRKDFEKFRKLKKHYDGCIFETATDGHKDFPYSYGKFYDTNSTFIEKAGNNTKRGLYIDVFQLDDAGNSVKEAQALYKKLFLSRVILQSRIFPVKANRSFAKNAAGVFARLIPFYSPNKAAAKLDAKASSNMGKNAYKGIFLGTEDIDHAFIKASIYGKPTLYKFEDASFYGPERGDEYLEKIFGDWKKLPPEEERITRHDYIGLDLNRSYLD